MHAPYLTYWQTIWKKFCRHRLGLFASFIILLFVITSIYAPLLASSKPLMVNFQDQWYFPLFRYLFYPRFFTKHLDIFYNLLIFTFPLFILTWASLRFFALKSRLILGSVVLLHFCLFVYLVFYPPSDPAISLSPPLAEQKHALSQQKFLLTPSLPLSSLPNWEQEILYLNSYAQLNLVLKYQQYKIQKDLLAPYEDGYHDQMKERQQLETVFPSLWNLNYTQEKTKIDSQEKILSKMKKSYLEAKFMILLMTKHCQTKTLAHLPPWLACDFSSKIYLFNRSAFIQLKQTLRQYETKEAELKYLVDRRQWLEKNLHELKFEVMPLIRPFHWEEDAGGDQTLNQTVNWWNLTRINRKDMVASLIFGIRVSLSVGLLAIGLALCIGIPVGAYAGYYGGKLDLIVYRLIEIWESMPVFFMLLMMVAFLQSKSIFLVIAVIGFFGWTNFSRFIRGEFFRQKQLLYVEACHALGYSDRYIIFSHLLPNAIPPLLTLVPFAIMSAITSEAALSFLGLGEEGSNSWGILMDEGRSAFPAESDLLWPPAILLTLLLVSIALVGDSLRDVLDPKNVSSNS